MRKAVVCYVRPMLTTSLDPTKKGRTLFASHSLYNKGPPPPAGPRRGPAGVLWVGLRIPLYSHRLLEAPRSFHRSFYRLSSSQQPIHDSSQVIPYLKILFLICIVVVTCLPTKVVTPFCYRFRRLGSETSKYLTNSFPHWGNSSWY